jgi:hypothetical protein
MDVVVIFFRTIVVLISEKDNFGIVPLLLSVSDVFSHHMTMILKRSSFTIEYICRKIKLSVLYPLVCIGYIHWNMNNTECCKMYLNCNAEFIEYASTSFGHTNGFGCVQIIRLCSCSAMMHWNYQTGSPGPIVTHRGDRTPCLYSIKYRLGFFEGCV